jgi:two-component system heavy metal sensor histidine kinase CusS
VKLRVRLVAAMAALTLLTLGLSFWAVALAFDRGRERQLDAALRVEALASAEKAVDANGVFSIADGPGLEENHAGPLPVYGVVYDDQGTPRAATSTFLGEAPHIGLLHPDLEPFDFSRGSLRLRAVMAPVPRRHGAFVMLAVPRTDLDADAAFLGRAMLGVFGIACVWSLLVPVWLIRRLTRDHQAIADVVLRVAGGDLDARVGSRSADPEIARLAASVDTMIERVGELVSSQQRFVAHAAHELRSPLTLVQGQLALALRRPRDEAEYREAIGEALDAAAHLRALTEELLDFSRASAAASGPFEPVSLVRAAYGGARYARADAERAGIAITVHGPASEDLVPGRPADLERLVRNLVENAVRHSPPGGLVLVEVAAGRARHDGGHPHTPGIMEIAITDEGSGVPEPERARLFEPFFRGTAARGSSGAGLGLAIVREIARAHGGDVHLDPTAPRGARFVVRLPRWESVTMQPVAAPPAAAAALQPA